MRNYGQHCPIARASEIIAERWTPIIIRNLLLGCITFNAIAEGAPGLSRGLLSTRLRELDRAGVIEIRAKEDQPGSTYELTEAGRELSAVLLALQHWGTQWVELAPEHAHPGVVLWAWVTGYLRRDLLPDRRTVIRFEYTTLRGPGCRAWLLVDHGSAEVCEKHPGGDEDLVVHVHQPLAFARWQLGEITWREVLRCGALELTGSRALARALPTWNAMSTSHHTPPTVAPARPR
jgi:DNA-binding HxlR family transcriptional regulator